MCWENALRMSQWWSSCGNLRNSGGERVSQGLRDQVGFMNRLDYSHGANPGVYTHTHNPRKRAKTVGVFGLTTAFPGHLGKILWVWKSTWTPWSVDETSGVDTKKGLFFQKPFLPGGLRRFVWIWRWGYMSLVISKTWHDKDRSTCAKNGCVSRMKNACSKSQKKLLIGVENYQGYTRFAGVSIVRSNSATQQLSQGVRNVRRSRYIPVFKVETFVVAFGLWSVSNFQSLHKVWVPMWSVSTRIMPKREG